MLDETITKLTNELSENENSIKKNKYNIHELNLYDFEERIGRISLLGTMLFLPIWISTFLLGVPTIFAPLINIGGSFGIGIIVNTLMEKKAKCKERFNKITKSKNESERIEEVLRNEMNIERLTQRNDIISKIKEKYEEESNILNSFSKNKRFSISYNKSNYSKDELKKIIQETEIKLKEKYNLLDNLSNESFLKEKTNKSNDKLSHLFYSMIATTTVLLLSVISLFPIMMNPLPSPSMIPLITTLGLGSLVFGGSLIHFSLKGRNTRKAIKSISKNDDYNKNNEFDLSCVKSEITNLLYSLNTYRNEFNYYDGLHRNSNLQKFGLSFEDEYTLDDEKKLTLK